MGLLDKLTNLSPDQTQGLLGAAAALLQAGGPSRTPVTFGQALSGGILGFQQAQQAAQDRTAQQQLQSLRLKGLQGELDDQERARKKAAEEDQALRDSFVTPGMQALAGGGGPTSANAAQIQNMQGGLDIDGYISRLMGINLPRALELRKALAKPTDEFDTTPRTGTDKVTGEDFQYIISKGGKLQRLDGVAPRDELKLANLGGRDVAYNPFKLQPGQVFQRTMTPGEAASNQLGLANLGISRARLALDTQQAGKPVFNAEAGGFVLPPSVANPMGKLLPLAGLNRTKNMTEDQAKATGWLVQAENAYKNLRDVAFVKGKDGKFVTDKSDNLILSEAARPGFGDAVASVPLLSGLGNALRSADRQKFNQASSTLSEAFLRAATGAGVNRDEALQKVQEITPVWGEDPAVSKQKLDSIPLYIDSLKVRAGTGAAQAANVLAPKSNNGWSITKVE